MLERIVSEAVAGAAQALAGAVQEAQRLQTYSPALAEQQPMQTGSDAAEAQVPYRTSGDAADSFLEGLEHAAADDTNPVATAQIMATAPAAEYLPLDERVPQPQLDSATAAHFANMDAQLESLWAEPAVAGDAEERAVRIAAHQATLNNVYDERDKQREIEAAAARQERQRSLLEQYPQYDPGFTSGIQAQPYAEQYIQPYSAPQTQVEEGAAV